VLQPMVGQQKQSIGFLSFNDSGQSTGTCTVRHFWQYRRQNQWI